MLNTLFLIPVILYFIASALQISAYVFKKSALKRLALIVLAVSFAVHTAYIVARGVTAGRVPMSNQFEFDNTFAWGVALLGLILCLRGRGNMDWMVTLCAPIAFLIISYAAQQPREIAELMPALRSSWFVLHIGSAVFSYAGFALAAGIGVRYLAAVKKADEKALRQMDRLAYKFIAFGFLMLTVVIISGMIWAEQAWSTFWSWDPKEVWALITWIVYAVYLHNYLRMKWRGGRMAWFAIIAFVAVMFTFMGVNKLMSGLHSYA